MFSLKLFNHKHVSFYDGKNRDVFYEIEKNLRRQEHQKAGKKKNPPAYLRRALFHLELNSLIEE